MTPLHHFYRWVVLKAFPNKNKKIHSYLRKIMSTNEKMSCCPATAWGKLIETEHNTSFEGLDITIGDVEVPAYVNESAPAPTKAIVIFPDM